MGGWQTSYAYESLMVIGAYCQHSKFISFLITSCLLFYLGVDFRIQPVYRDNLSVNPCCKLLCATFNPSSFSCAYVIELQTAQPMFLGTVP